MIYHGITETLPDRDFGDTSPGDLPAFNDEESSNHGEEMVQHGHAAPTCAAKAFAAHLLDARAPILNPGCGTGTCGVVPKAFGFTVVDGCDVSQGMLSKGREKSVHRSLDVIEPDEPLAFPPCTHSAIIAISVLCQGTAPYGFFNKLLKSLAKGRKLVLLPDDFTGKKRGALARIHEYVDNSGAQLPTSGLKSTIFIPEKN